jgi:hypothetical protein
MVGHKAINKQVVISIGFGVILMGTLLALCFLFAPSGESHWQTVSMNLAVLVTGWASGWVAGTLVAPYDPGETRLFTQISKGMSAFASGFLVGKIDSIFSSLHESGVFPLSEYGQFRVLLYFSVTIIIMLIVFFARKYGNWHRDGQPAPDAAGASDVSAATEPSDAVVKSLQPGET